MAKNGLDKWFKQKWVDIGSKRKDGSFAKCGRSKQKKDAKRKYPKCVPLAKARRMSEGQRRSAVARKRAAANVGPKPTNVKTFTSRKKAEDGGMAMVRQAQRNYTGTHIKGDLGGVKVGIKAIKNIIKVWCSEKLILKRHYASEKQKELQAYKGWSRYDPSRCQSLQKTKSRLQTKNSGYWQGQTRIKSCEET